MTLLFKEHKYWYRDHESPETIDEMMNFFGDKWNALLKQDIGISEESKTNWKKQLKNFHDEVSDGEDYEFKEWKF